MKKNILIGSILAVALLTLVSFTSVVGYSSVKSNPSNTIITDEYDNATPIQFVLQLITKLRNHKDIQNVETEDDVIRIIEGDEELNAIVDKLKSFDCGCEDGSSPLGWNFPVLCLLLFPLVMVFTVAHLMTGIDLPFYIMMEIGSILNCMWQL